jgi:hypothetical protein
MRSSHLVFPFLRVDREVSALASLRAGAGLQLLQLGIRNLLSFGDAELLVKSALFDFRVVDGAGHKRLPEIRGARGMTTTVRTAATVGAWLMARVRKGIQWKAGIDKPSGRIGRISPILLRPLLLF